jgi:hypothetical protein
MMKYQIKQLMLAAGLSITAISAQAVTLSAGDILALPGTTAAAEPQLAGTVLVDEIIPFSFTNDGGLSSGNVQQRVVRSSVDNTIDFYWRIINGETSAPIGSLRVGDFIANEYNANFRVDGLGVVAPDSAHRFLDIQDTFVNFLFADGVSAGQDSNFFFLDTTATNYAKTAIFDLTGTGNGGISNVFAAYAPAAAVPEPEVYAMLLAGLGLVGFAARQKQVKKT